MVIQVIIGYLLADFLAGFWHWAEDRYFQSNWPLVGRYIAAPNELHHARPTAFLDQGYLSRNWTTILPAVIALAIAVYCSAPVWVLAMFAFVSQANEIHAWAHRRAQWRVIRGLQEFGVFQSPRHHAVHHKSPFDCRYCVMTDWLNPVLDMFRFWFGLEYLLGRCGVKVKVT